MKLSSSAFLVLTVGVGCGKTTNAAAAAADDPNTAVTAAVNSNKNKDKNPIVNVTVADVPAAAITARNLIAPTCSGNRKLIEVDVFTDQDPEETLWTVTKNIEYEGEAYTSTTPILSGGPYSQAKFLFQDAWCVPKGQYKFNIYDIYSDGIHGCEEGYYRFGFDGDEVTNNDFSDGFSQTNTLGEISQARSKAGKRSQTKAGCSTSEKLIQVDYSIGDYNAWEYTWTVTKNIEYEGEKYTSIKPILSGAYSSADNEKVFNEVVSVPEGEYQFNIYGGYYNGQVNYTVRYGGDEVVTNTNYIGWIRSHIFGSTCPASTSTIQSSLMTSGGKSMSPFIDATTLTLIAALSAFFFVTF